jgi:hypothetical protein
MNKMTQQLKKLLTKQYPQSFLIEKPLWGTLVFTLVLFLFATIYQPLQMHAARSFSFSLTILLYSLLISTSVLVVTVLLKKITYFSNRQSWTLQKELISIGVILMCIGLTSYFAGFIMESPASRWNLLTFFDSFSRSVLIGIIPLLLPSILNIRFAFTPEIYQEFNPKEISSNNITSETIIHIQSKAKKEKLSFSPDEFLFAESSGNYVVFHLCKQEKTYEVLIRNSITEIQTQLADIPSFLRTHRAFIVNVEKVISKNGNSLGYQLRLKNHSQTVPVSRQNTQLFDDVTRQFLPTIHP